MHTPPRGLATIALIKTRRDEGKDHLGLFEPFVVDALCFLKSSDFIASDIKDIVLNRDGIDIPVDTIQTLLKRASKHEYIERAGGRFFLRSRPPSSLAEEHAQLLRHIQADQELLAEALVAYATSQGCTFSDATEALNALATFISDNKVALILDEFLPDSPLDRSSLGRKATRVVARFISDKCIGHPEFESILSTLLEGMILKDTLLLSDIASIPQAFQDLSVYLDTPIVFSAIGLTGAATATATREGLSLLRDAGAITAVFGRTISEVRRILAVYEVKLATSRGRLELYPTDLTHHILTEGMSPSDVRIISATLDQRLNDVGVKIREIPEHVARFTLDEEELAVVLSDKKSSSDYDTPRVRHDVDCIAAVLTLRAGWSTTSLAKSKAVFCSTSGRVIRNAQNWYFSQGGRGVPPIIHQLALSNIAWLKRPGSGAEVKLHELAAICSAALKPSRPTWELFVSNLRKLRNDRAISDDEAVAIIASDLTEHTLAEIDEENDPDSDTVLQAIERVRARYREEAIADATQLLEMERREMRSTEEKALSIQKRGSQIAQTAEGRVNSISRVVAATFYGLCAVLLLATAVFSIPGVFDSVGETWKWVARLILGISAIFGVYAGLKGESVTSLTGRFELHVAHVVRKLLYGSDHSLEADTSVIHQLTKAEDDERKGEAV